MRVARAGTLLQERHWQHGQKAHVLTFIAHFATQKRFVN
jgi:hypothetical protein